MPNYLFRCQAGHKTEQFQPMSAPIPGCDCGLPQVRVIQPVAAVFRHGMRGDMREYREDLARFPNDPRAFVDGPKSLQKLIDQTKREGATISSLDEVRSPKQPDQPSKAERTAALKDLHERAKAVVRNGTDGEIYDNQ